MPSLPDLIGRIRIDTSDLDRASQEAQTRGVAIGSAMGSAVGNLAAAGLDAAISSVMAFVAGSVDAFAEFEDAAAAAGVRFGESVGIVNEFASRSTEAFGISKSAALEGANTFAVFGKAAGLAGDDLATFSVGMVQLAGDMASFSGGTPEEAIAAIGSAFRGETDPIERYGVMINAAAVENKALEMGLISQGQEMTNNARVMATQALILEQTADAHGDFARNIEGTANQQKLLAARSADASIELGEKLAPAFLFVKQAMLALIEGITFFAGIISTAVRTIWEWRDAILITVTVLGILNAQTIAANVAMAVYLGWLGAVRIATTAWTAVQWLLNAAMTANPIGLVVAAIGLLVGAFIVAWNHSETFRNFIGNLWTALGRFVGDALNWFGSFGRGVADAFNSVIGWIGRLIDWVVGLPGNIGRALASLPGIVWRWIVQTWQDAVELHNRILFGMIDFIQSVPGWVSRHLSALPGIVWRFIVETWQNVSAKAVEIINGLLNWIRNIGAWINSALGGIPGMVWNFIVGAFTNAANAAQQWIGNLLNYVRDIPRQIVNALSNLPATMFQIGANIIDGILAGLRSMGGRIVSYLTNLIPGPLKAALGIASRSKVMERIGYDAVDGLAYGLESLRSRIRQIAHDIGLDAQIAVQRANDGGISISGTASVQRPGGGPAIQARGAVTIDARSFGTQLTPDDVADAIMWASRVGGMVPA